MFQTFKNAWKTPDLKRKILFTIMVLLLYRIGATISVPYVNTVLLETISFSGTALEFLSMFSGGAMAQASFFALSVSPYITASIVMQLLTIAIPALEKLSKEGDEGKKKITKYTRIVTVGLAIITAWGYVRLLSSYNGLNYLTVSKADGFMYYFAMIVMIACYCAGAAIVMWLAEQINAYGVGNGISMILFANIIAGFTMTVTEMYYMVISETEVWGYVLAGVKILLSVLLTIAAVGFIVWFTNSERRIPIQYAKRVVGRKMYGGQSSNLPLKLNMAGVMPVIFASSIVAIPATIAGLTGSKGAVATWITEWLGQTSPLYIALNVILIVAFSYFYIMISFNPVEVANNIRNQGGSIPGIRPGKPTSDYIKKILNRITLLGAIFLLVIQVVPMIANAIFVACKISFPSIAFTGTSLLIVVGVALEVVRDIEAQLAMRNYKGFLD